MNTGLPAFRTLILQTGGAAATLTLNRPDALNAIDVAMAEDLQRAAQWLETRRHSRGHAAGRGQRVLCRRRHLDVRRRGLRGARITDGPVHAAQRFPRARRAHGQGLAGAGAWHRRGAGLSLTLACDLAIAEAGTRFMTAYLAGRHARCRHDARSDAHRGTKAGAGPAAAARSVQRRGSAVLGPGHPSGAGRSAARTGGSLRGRHRRPCAARHRRRQAAAALGGAGYAGNPAQ